MVYNPLDIEITRTIRVNAYYTGLHNKVQVTDSNGKTLTLTPDRNYFIDLNITIAPRSQSWYIMK